MTVRKIIPTHYEMSSGDTPPTGVLPITTLRETDTNRMWITYDGGTTWIVADKRVRLVEADGTLIDLPAEFAALLTLIGAAQDAPAAYTLLKRLKDIVTAVAALGYQFTINGINFDGYAKIKSLTLDTGAYNDHPQTLHDGGIDYKPASGTVFVAFQALAWNQQLEMVGRIGEGTATPNEAITKEVLKLSNGTNKPFMTNCYGVFTAGKYITAESNSGSSNYCLQAGSVLYGAEIDI